MEKDRDRLELDNSKRYYSKIKVEDTDDDIESLGVSTPRESLEANGLKRKLDYLAGFGDTTKRLRQADNRDFVVSKFGISRKRRRNTDSEDENTEGFTRVNKSQRSEDKLVEQFSRLRTSSDTKVQTKQKLAELISGIRVCLANAEAMAKNLDV